MNIKNIHGYKKKLHDYKNVNIKSSLDKLVDFSSSTCIIRSDSPVYTDGSEVENGRRAAQDVESYPNVTQDVAQHPQGVVHLNF